MMPLDALCIAFWRLVGNETGAEVMEYVAWAGMLIAAVILVSLTGFTNAITDKIAAIVNSIPGGS